MAREKLISVKLVCDKTSMNTHIEHRFKHKTVRKGMQVVLEDDERVWNVAEVYGEPVERSTIKRGWSDSNSKRNQR